jgi:hypothetical protein
LTSAQVGDLGDSIFAIGVVAVDAHGGGGGVATDTQIFAGFLNVLLKAQIREFLAERGGGVASGFEVSVGVRLKLLQVGECLGNFGVLGLYPPAPVAGQQRAES